MLYYVERAAQVQIYAMWTGQKLKQLRRQWLRKQARITRTSISTRARPRPAALDALKRMLDRKEPDYAT